MRQDIYEDEWDILVVLDACRYDYLEKKYQNFFDGELKQRKSKASNTGEWLSKTFADQYNFTYISSNPYINSFGLSLKECNPKFDYNWKATDHFSKIIDVWFNRWDQEIGTVLPKEVNMAYFKNKKDGNKKILHYLQPHLPYLSRDSIGSWENTFFRIKRKAGKQKEITKRLSRWIRPRLRNYLGKMNYWKLRRILGLKPRNPFENAWRKQDNKELKKHYEKNLETVLETVKNLVEEINKKIIITADHGESFGEKGIWGHPPEKETKALKTVPWLKIDSPISS